MNFYIGEGGYPEFHTLGSRPIYVLMLKIFSSRIGCSDLESLLYSLLITVI